MTVLSELIDAAFPIPELFPVATLAAMFATTVPGPVIPVTATKKVLGPPVRVTVLVPGAVPAMVTSPLVKPDTGSLKAAVKRIGAAFVGSG